MEDDVLNAIIENSFRSMMVMTEDYFRATQLLYRFLSGEIDMEEYLQEAEERLNNDTTEPGNP